MTVPIYKGEDNLTMSEFTVVTLDQRPDLIDAADTLASQSGAWPEFMLHDPIADEHFWRLYDTFPAYQVVLLDEEGEIAALGNTIPVTWDGLGDSLPNEGWDAIMQIGVKNHRRKIKPNCASAIQAVVALKYRRQGVSQALIKAMRSAVRQQGLSRLIAPVRPNHKHLYPLTSMERYIEWQRADGTLFDPWLRTHARLGAKIMKVCPRSMTISAPLAKWEGWTGLRLPESGVYIIPGALVPLGVDRERNVATYVEPNVWMLHEIGEA